MHGRAVGVSVEDAARGAKLGKRRERFLFGAVMQVARQAVAFLHHRQVLGLLEQFHVRDRDRSTMGKRREQACCVITDQIWPCKTDIEHANHFMVHTNGQMNERADALCQHRFTHIRPEAIRLKLPHNGRSARIHDLTHNPLALFEFHHFQRLWRKPMADTRDDLFLLFIPSQNHTAIGIEDFHRHIHQRLKDLLQAHVTENPFICLIQRLDFLIAFFQSTGSFSNEAFQLAIAVLHGFGSQSDAASHH